jgi:thiamine-phosphate pyrophosphorylase
VSERSERTICHIAGVASRSEVTPVSERSERTTPTGLPPLLVLTDRTQCPGGDLLSTVDKAVAAGARAVVLREKDLPGDERSALADGLHALLAPAGGLLILAGTALPASHVHLAARDPVPTPRPALLGRSCHDAAELRRAAVERCDYVTLSPVFASPSKPGYGPALGLAAFAALAAAAGPPVYALGGVRPDEVPGCLDAGARGIAVMGPVMREPRIVSDYLGAVA